MLYMSIALGGLFLAVAWLFARQGQSQKQQLNALKQLKTELSQLKKDQHLALQGSYGMGQRMLKLEKRLRQMQEDHDKEPPLEQPFSYTQATQMIAEGADEQAIAATCGISHSEAHLMRKLCAKNWEESPV